MTDKCIVKGCTNHKDEGEFVGDLCLPCYLMLTDARTGPSDAWFVTVIKELLAVIKVIEINAEECMDFDECTAMLVPIDDYHRLIEVVESVKAVQHD